MTKIGFDTSTHSYERKFSEDTQHKQIVGSSPIPKDLDHWELIDSYKAGSPIWFLAKKYAIPASAVVRRLKAEGITIRLPSKEMTKNVELLKSQTKQMLAFFKKVRRKTSTGNVV